MMPHDLDSILMKFSNKENSSTRTIRDGQLVRVHGTAGYVEVLD